MPLLRIGGLFILSLLAASSLFAQKDDSALLSPVEVAGEQYQAGKLDDALATLDRLEKSLSPTMESQDLRGRVYLEQGKFDEAMRAFEAAHARKYEAFAPKIHVADALRRQKKFKEARAEYDKLVEIKAPMWPEYARFGVLVCYLAEHDEDRARRLVETIVFPSGSPVYYYAQAAWAFAHGKDSEGRKWIASAKKIFDVSKTSWFERGLYELGWIKKKPPLTVDTFL